MRAAGCCLRPLFFGAATGNPGRIVERYNGVQPTMGRWGKCIVVSAALVIIGSFLVPAVLLIRFASKSGLVRDEIKRIKAEGSPVSVADLVGKPIPQSSNAALVYEKALKYLDTEPARQDMLFIRSFVGSSESVRDARSWSRLCTIIEQYSTVLDLARRAAAMPQCRFSLDTRRSRDYMGRQFGLRSLPRLAWAEALVHARAGRADRALDSVELIFAMGESMRSDLTHAGTESRYRAIGTGTDALLDVARLCVISETEARRLADVLARIDLRNAAVKTLEAERAQGIVLFEELRKGGFRFDNADNDSDNPLDRAHGIVPAGWLLNNDELRFLRDIRKQIELARLPYREIKSQGEANTDAPRYSLYGPGSASMAVRSVLAQDQAVARLNGNRIFLGLLAYRSRFGSYPVALDQLRAELKWPVPADPFSGKDFRYRRQGRGFILYSIGGDLKDNGGKPWGGGFGWSVWRRGGIAQDPDEEGDYVWKL